MREQILFDRNINQELAKISEMVLSFLDKNDIVDTDGKVKWPCYVCIEKRERSERNH